MEAASISLSIALYLHTKIFSQGFSLYMTVEFIIVYFLSCSIDECPSGNFSPLIKRGGPMGRASG